jgi:hypothetical protein
MKIEMYGILYLPTNQLLGICANSNNSEDCVDVSFELDLYSENIWLVSKKEDAEKVKITNTPWYNAEYKTPMNTYDETKLQVVKINMEIEND